MEYKHILVKVSEGVGWLTVNRPESLNALNSEVIEDLSGALHDLDEDSSVKVVVLTGAGEKAFVAGGDIKEMSEMTPLQARDFARRGQRLMQQMAGLHKPIIAAVNGYALGGGLELALACDFIYASERARLGLPEVTLGVMPGFGGTQNLPRLIGANKAREMIFSGKPLTAEQSKEWGLVNAVFPPEALRDAVAEVALSIARNGSIAVESARDAIANGLNMSRQDGLRYESALFATLFSTDDQKEGMQAFVEKRKAAFKGK